MLEVQKGKRPKIWNRITEYQVGRLLNDQLVQPFLAKAHSRQDGPSTLVQPDRKSVQCWGIHRSPG